MQGIWKRVRAGLQGEIPLAGQDQNEQSHSEEVGAQAAEGGAVAEAAGAAVEGTQAAEGGKKKRKRPPVPVIVLIVVVAIVLLLCIAFGLYIVIAQNFVDQENVTRETWEEVTGEQIDTDRSNKVGIYEADLDSELEVLQIQPTEVNKDGFTYYDVDVQERLEGAVENLIADAPEEGWTAAAPLAILNPFGTGSNGLLLYFETDEDAQLSYLIETEGCDDWEATATGGFTQVHEVQIIGLVPGETNHLTLTLTDESGEVCEQAEFDLTMPETYSDYTTQLDYTDGESTVELADGLYTLTRMNGYLGYGFFFDSGGTMRYEMVTEGYGLDRVVEYDGDIIVCISNSKMARIDGLGRVVSVYDLSGYILHHDINEGQDGQILVAAQHAESADGYVEDLVLELDPETGEFYELVDFSEFMSDYVQNYTHVITLSDPEAYMNGEWDWMHLNTVQYLDDGQDSMIVSSRETNTIIKLVNVHSDPEIAWMCGNPEFWEGTGYEQYCLEAVGDFKYQYGQHTVEYAGAGDEDGVYYLRMYDNNYWSLSTRDFSLDLEDGVCSSYLGGDCSYVYVYKIDENEGTFELVESFDVPYSSIVSSAAPSDVWLSYRVENQDEAYDMSGKTWIVNSGVGKIFGEYDEDGQLIREFTYEGDLQGYRVIKYTLEGFWFADEEGTAEADAGGGDEAAADAADVADAADEADAAEGAEDAEAVEEEAAGALAAEDESAANVVED